MKINLNYGRDVLSLDLPPEWRVQIIKKPAMPIFSDPGKAVWEALNNPIEALPLKKLKGRSACIVICDITRPVPNHLLLRPIIQELRHTGMRLADIKILVATGLHRPNLDDELKELVGDEWVLQNVSIVNHYARRDEDHVDLGLTSKNTRILLDKRLVEADIKIITGLVEPHFMAGYSGGRKVITPGVCHQETITRLHSAFFMENPLAANCSLAGNPLHEEQMEIARLLGSVLAVNVVLDEERNLSCVTYGDLCKSHEAAMNYLRPYAEIMLPHRFKTILTCGAGYPLDQTYYQTIKGMLGAQEILDANGHVFIASHCGEGMGSPEFIDAQIKLTQQGKEAFWQSLKAKSHAAIDEWQTEMMLKILRQGQVTVYAPNLKPEDLAITGTTVTSDLLASMSQWINEINDPNIAVIPEGPYVVPRYKGE